MPPTTKKKGKAQGPLDVQVLETVYSVHIKALLKFLGVVAKRYKYGQNQTHARLVSKRLKHDLR